MSDWVEITHIPALERYAPCVVYNEDEMALFYKSLPHHTYCKRSEKPAGSSKYKDRLPLLLVMKMDEYDHCKLSVIGNPKKDT